MVEAAQRVPWKGKKHDSSISWFDGYRKRCAGTPSRRGTPHTATSDLLHASLHIRQAMARDGTQTISSSRDQILGVSLKPASVIVHDQHELGWSQLERNKHLGGLGVFDDIV